jgi:phosphate transport system substrate-binding protein
VNWPAAAGAKENDGVVATTHNTRGGIGYAEGAYAIQNHLVTTRLRNKAGQFVEPTMASFSAAASGDWANVRRVGRSSRRHPSSCRRTRRILSGVAT